MKWFCFHPPVSLKSLSVGFFWCTEGLDNTSTLPVSQAVSQRSVIPNWNLMQKSNLIKVQMHLPKLHPRERANHCTLPSFKCLTVISISIFIVIEASPESQINWNILILPLFLCFLSNMFQFDFRLYCKKEL